MTRIEAAVQAWDHYWGDRYGDEALEEMGDEVKVALDAADAHDAAHGIHRVSLDDATVERAARALFLAVSPKSVWDGLAEHSYLKLSYMTAAQTMLAAAVEVGQ